MNFTTADIQQIEENQLNIETVNQQIQLFAEGLSFINLQREAVVDDGIYSINTEKSDQLVAQFERKLNDIEVLKFVPASGSATRMFKFIYEFLDQYHPEKESINSFINNNNAKDLSLFFIAIKKLPFYEDVINRAKITAKNIVSDTDKLHFLQQMLNNSGGCNFGNVPKGLLPFHKYKNHIATAFEEHLFEASQYVASNGMAKLHFTISEKHHQKFKEELQKITKIVSEKTNTTFDISFSFQKKKTDTIAVTFENKPFRNKDGSLLFRPSGHGALIENLNDLKADIIFIKNIDNVVTHFHENEVSYYKKMLGGLLLELQNEVFQYHNILDSETLSPEKIIEIANFLYQKLNIVIHDDFEKFAQKYQIEYLRDKIDRPIRVCGMVKNEGEPGGGPFWVKAENGSVSLQIVEGSQINKKNPTQLNIIKKSTHFNPVDVVCSVKNYKGEKYNLLNFVDHSSAFITKKTKNGKKLKALESPGLWNGSMANWNTIFVEVPLLTFNPVKTILDLLKPTHQV